jgi:hypothetical protein
MKTDQSIKGKMTMKKIQSLVIVLAMSCATAYADAPAIAMGNIYQSGPHTMAKVGAGQNAIALNFATGPDNQILVGLGDQAAETHPTLILDAQAPERMDARVVSETGQMLNIKSIKVIRFPAQGVAGQLLIDGEYTDLYGHNTQPFGGTIELKSQTQVSAFPTPVNPQITDSVTQVNTKVLGDAPGMAMGNLYQSTGQALSNAAHNAIGIQTR